MSQSQSPQSGANASPEPSASKFAAEANAASLPASPSLEQLRKRSRELLHDYRDGVPDAVTRVQRYFSGPDEQKPFTLVRAQLVVARECGFPSWARLKSYVDRLDAPAQVQRVFQTDIAYFKGRAHGLWATWRDGLPSSLRQIRDNHPDYATASDAAIAAAAFTVEDAQLVLAREHGFASWRRLANHLTAVEKGVTTEPFREAFLALQQKDGKRLTEVLGQDPGVALAPGTNGNSLLNLAGSLKFGEGSRLLLAAGADPNQGNRYGWTPLHQAAYSNQLELAQLLLDAGASPYLAARGDGGTPLVQALFWGHDAMADLLAAVAVTPLNLRVAAGVGRLDLVRGCFGVDGKLVASAGEHRAYYRPHPGFPAWTPTTSAMEIIDEAFVYAAKCGRHAVLDFLLSLVSGVDAEPYNGNALIWAIFGGRLETVQWLLDRGAQVNQLAAMGGELHVTPLHTAAWHNREAVARLLVERGADVAVRDGRYQGTPLGWARHNDSPAVAAYLESMGAPD